MKSESKNEKWFGVEIIVDLDVSEAAEFALNELDSLGNEINNLDKKDAKTVTVIGYFNSPPEQELIREKVNEALNIYNAESSKFHRIEINEVENQDWLAEWKKHWKPTETDLFVVSPPWENLEFTDKIVIEIEPNMAFGTGTHETTQLCLRAIERFYREDMSFFDVGTGTGILSIAVSKLGEPRTNKILACDVDRDSIDIARENAVQNNAVNIEFYVGSISKETSIFDFVCANVTVDIIVPMLPLLVEKFSGILVLSGILVEQKEIILTKLETLGIEKPLVERDGEWISITIEK